MDRHPCRSDLRFALAIARPRGGLCVRGREGEVCERLRRGVDQGDEPRPLRPRLISAERFSGLHVSLLETIEKKSGRRLKTTWNAALRQTLTTRRSEFES